jgi:hypothetical protein
MDTLSSLQTYVEAQPTALRRFPRVRRRLVRLTVSGLAEHPTDLSEPTSPWLKEHVKTRYRQVYGNPLLGMILLQILVSVVARLVADWILNWWHNRHQDPAISGQDADQAVNGLLQSLKQEAEAEIAAGADAGAEVAE